MIVLQQAQAMSEPILIGGAVTGIGGVAYWVVSTLISVRDNVRDMHQAMFGHPDSPKPGGLVVTVEDHEQRLGAVEEKVRTLSSDGAG